MHLNTANDPISFHQTGDRRAVRVIMRPTGSKVHHLARTPGHSLVIFMYEHRVHGVRVIRGWVLLCRCWVRLIPGLLEATMASRHHVRTRTYGPMQDPLPARCLA